MAQNAPGYPASASQNMANAVRRSEVQEQVERSANLVGRLEDRIKLLNERLSPVLRSTSSMLENGKTSAPRPTLVGHATSLSNHNDQLDVLDTVIADILDRLEL